MGIMRNWNKINRKSEKDFFLFFSRILRIIFTKNTEVIPENASV